MDFESEVSRKLTDVLPAEPRLTRTELRFAGFWFRALAAVIDFTLLGGTALVVASSVHLVAPTDFQAVANILPVTSAIAWAYFCLLESSPLQATVGKLALGLVVSDMHGDAITFRRSFFRYMLKGVSTLLLGLGYVLAAFTPRKQALHDLLVGTVVLRRVEFLVPVSALPTEPGEHWDGIRWVASVAPMEKS